MSTINSIPRDFKGIWIPREIWLDQRLTYFEKILLAEINSLDNPETGCYASNQYFCDFFNERERKIQDGLAKLKSLGFITVESFDGRVRVLRSTLNPVKTLFSTPEVSNSAPLTCRKSTPLTHREFPGKENKEENKDKKTTTPPTPSRGGEPAKPAVVADSIEAQLKKSKLNPEQQKEAIEFYRSNRNMIVNPKIDNPVGYLIKLVETCRHKTIASDQGLIARRKEEAFKMGTVSGIAGCYEPGEEGILKMSGSKQELIRYDQEHSFWTARGLGNPSKNDFKG